MGPKNIEYSPGDSTFWEPFQRIPSGAPPGSTYVYTVKAGFFPDVTISSDNFVFTVLGELGQRP